MNKINDIVCSIYGLLKDPTAKEESGSLIEEKLKELIEIGEEMFSVDEQKEIISELSYLMDFSRGYKNFLSLSTLSDLVPGVSTLSSLPYDLRVLFGLPYKDLPLLINSEEEYVEKEVVERIITWRLLKGK